LKFEKLFHKDEFGTPYRPDPAVESLQRGKRMIQPQGPLPGRLEEIDALADEFGRDPGVLHFPAREVQRLVNDEDWDFDEAITARAAEVLDIEGLPNYPDEMRETFSKLLSEHGIGTGKFLPPQG